MTTITDAVLAALSQHPYKASDLAKSCELQSDQVSGALWALQKNGMVERIGAKRPYTWRLVDGVEVPQALPDPVHNDPSDDTEIFVGAFASGDVQIGVGEEALRITEGQARSVHRLLERMFGANE